MSKQGKVRKLFPGGNTSQGFYSLYDNMIKADASRIFVIKGGPGVGKSSFMKYIGYEMVNRGFDSEFHYCSSDPDSLDGVVFPAIGVAVCDGTAPHVIDPKNPGAVDEIIHFGEYWDNEKIETEKDSIIKINRQVKKCFDIAYSLLKESKVAYDELKGYVSEAVEKAKYNRIINILNETIFDGIAGNFQGAPASRHLFASAITPKGFVNYIDTLITKDMKVYGIKGEPGSGVKRLIKRMAQSAEEQGLYVEQFHCPYEPDEVDLIIIPAINTMIANVSKPYHADPAKLEGAVIEDIIDLDLCIDHEVLNEYKNEIFDAKNRHGYLMDKVIEHLKKAKGLHDNIEKYYIKAMNFDRINEKREEILERILRYAE